MFDIAPTELLLCAIVALLVIGPKDLPKAMRTVGHWVGRARGVARHFRAGFDTMVREAELEEMEKKWREENERIMREHPVASPPDPAPASAPQIEAVEQSAVTPTPEPAETDEPAPEQKADKPATSQLDFGLDADKPQ